MGRRYGGQSMTGRLRRVLVRSAGEAFAEADPTTWHYAGRPDLAAAGREHRALVRKLEDAGAAVSYADDVPTASADSIYVYDPCLVSDSGGSPTIPVCFSMTSLQRWCSRTRPVNSSLSPLTSAPYVSENMWRNSSMIS